MNGKESRLYSVYTYTYTQIAIENLISTCTKHISKIYVQRTNQRDIT